MKFQTLNGWSTAMLALMLTFCSARAQNSCDRIESITMEGARQFSWIHQKLPKSIEKAQAIMPGNKLERNKDGQEANFYCNPLLMNGKPLNYANFSIESKGILTMVEGEPKSPGAVKIPFLIYLRRDGVILGQGEEGPEVYEIEVADILMFAQPGDHLIITPARKTDWKAKRIIKVIMKVGC